MIGPFATSNPENYIKAGAKVVKGEPEMFFHNFKMSIQEIKKLPQIISDFEVLNIDKLSMPGWETIFKLYKSEFYKI